MKVYHPPLHSNKEKRKRKIEIKNSDNIRYTMKVYHPLITYTGQSLHLNKEKRKRKIEIKTLITYAIL